MPSSPKHPAALVLAASLLVAIVGASLGLSRGQGQDEAVPAAQTRPADEPLTTPDGPALAPPSVAVDAIFETPVLVSPKGPATIVRTIEQAADGELWLGSFQGVFRYDGELFTSVTTEADLAPAHVFALLRDREDRMWVGTMGAGVYRHAGNDWTRFTHADGLAGDRVLALMQDREGAIWIGHEGAGATRYDGRSFTTFGASDGFTDGDVSSISQDGDGRIWLGSRDGLFHYDGDAFENFSVAHGLETGGYVPTLVDARGELWIGGGNGLIHTDGRTLHRVIPDPGYSILEHADGSISFHANGRFYWVTPPAAGEPFDAEVVPGALAELVFDTFQSRDGRLWVGTLAGFGQLEADGVRPL